MHGAVLCVASFSVAVVDARLFLHACVRACVRVRNMTCWPRGTYVGTDVFIFLGESSELIRH